MRRRRLQRRPKYLPASAAEATAAAIAAEAAFAEEAAPAAGTEEEAAALAEEAAPTEEAELEEPAYAAEGPCPPTCLQHFGIGGDELDEAEHEWFPAFSGEGPSRSSGPRIPPDQRPADPARFSGSPRISPDDFCGDEGLEEQEHEQARCRACGCLGHRDGHRDRKCFCDSCWLSWHVEARTAALAAEAALAEEAAPAAGAEEEAVVPAEDAAPAEEAEQVEPAYGAEEPPFEEEAALLMQAVVTAGPGVLLPGRQPLWRRMCLVPKLSPWRCQSSAATLTARAGPFLWGTYRPVCRKGMRNLQ